MQPRVTAILVARNGADYLERTLASLDAQTRQPDGLIVVDAGSSDATSEILARSRASQLVASSSRVTFGAAVGNALHVAGPPESADDWVWLLTADSAADAGALAALLGAVEVAPSVAVAGPKLMRWDEPDLIDSYGETLTRFGASVSLVDGELDQAQHDTHDDVMGVGAGGMLVRRAVWAELGG